MFSGVKNRCCDCCERSWPCAAPAWATDGGLLRGRSQFAAGVGGPGDGAGLDKARDVWSRAFFNRKLQCIGTQAIDAEKKHVAVAEFGRGGKASERNPETE